MTSGPEIHNKVRNLQGQVSSNIVEDIMVSRVIASQNTPFLLHRMIQRNWFKGCTVRSDSATIVRHLSHELEVS